MKVLIDGREFEASLIESRTEKSNLWCNVETENQKLKQEITVNNDKENVFRQFVIISRVCL